MINSAEIDIGNVLGRYGVKSVLEAMILYIGYETDYEINLKIALRTALENYENRYEEETEKYDPLAEKQVSPPKKMRIIKNAARCKKCGQVIISRHRHDFVMCDCGAIFVDGGLDYQRRGGNPENMEDLSEYEEE